MSIEIVGAQIGTTITNDPQIIAQAIHDRKIIRLLSRQEVNLISALDLGSHWTSMAAGPTLFIKDSDGGFSLADEDVDSK